MIASKRKMARYRSRPTAMLMNMAPEKMSAWKESRGGIRASWQGVPRAWLEHFSFKGREATLEGVHRNPLLSSVDACDFQGSVWAHISLAHRL